MSTLNINLYNGTVWANQDPICAMLLDTERGDLVLDISEKIKDLEYAEERRDKAISARVEKELKRIIKRYWKMPYKCFFATQKHPKDPIFAHRAAKTLMLR